MSREKRVRIRYPYPFRSAERSAIITVIAAVFGLLVESWHTEWYPAVNGDPRQVPVDHIVFQTSNLGGARIRVTQGLLFLMRCHVQMHHEPHTFRMPEEVSPNDPDATF
jgi:hypothetical protein